MARTEDGVWDTWDLATSVGATATMVAAGRARATAADQPLIEDRFAAPLVRAVGIDFFTRWAAGELDEAQVDIPGCAWGMQRMTDLLAVRTRHIDEFLAAAVAAGIRQTVILASGLDARAYRLPSLAGTSLFEIDQPQVLEFKATAIAELGVVPIADVRVVPIDLRDDWPAALREAGFDAARPTAWVAEGLLPFLPPEAQDRLLDTISELSPEGSRLIAEMFWNSDDAMQVMQAATQKWYDNGLDVVIDDLGFPGERHDLVPYLEERGWRTTRTEASQLLAEGGLPVPSGGDGEGAFPNYYCSAVRG